MPYILGFVVLAMLAMLGILVGTAVKDWLEDRSKYQYRGAIYLGYTVTPEGKHIYKFEDRNKTQIGLYGGSHHRMSLIEYSVYHVMAENNKYLKGVKKIV